MDKTDHIFSIIAGDERKDITITLDGLQTKNQFCQGLLLDEGQKHTIPKNVFQVEKVYSAFHDGKSYPTYRDDEHQHQQREAGIEITEANKHDTDVRKSDKAAANPSAVQQWTEGEDYEIVSDKEITLKLRYLYNKTMFEGLQKYSGSEYFNEAVNSIWTLRYFILSSDANQTYFLPISTCRYPNQIAKIKVYPDIEWELAALVSLGFTKRTFKFQSTRERLNTYHYRYHFKYVKRELSVEAETSNKVGADFTLKASTSGKEYEAGYKIEKSIKKVIGIFNAVYEKSEMFDGTNEDVTQSAAYKKGALKKFEFEIDPPNVAIALKWKHEIAKLERNKGQIGWRIEGGIALKPFVAFGITVDLVSIIGRFGWVGKAVEWIIKALEYTIQGLDIYINFKLNAEVAADLSIGYHSLDGWDEKAKKTTSATVRATIEAGVKLEDVTIIANIVSIGTDEKIEGVEVGGNLGTGIEYKEEWDADDKGMYKNVTVEFLGCDAEFFIYATITKRKRRVQQGREIEESYDKQITDKYKKTLLEKETWYGPEKIYTDD